MVRQESGSDAAETLAPRHAIFVLQPGRSAPYRALKRGRVALRRRRASTRKRFKSHCLPMTWRSKHSRDRTGLIPDYWGRRGLAKGAIVHAQNAVMVGNLEHPCQDAGYQTIQGG